MQGTIKRSTLEYAFAIIVLIGSIVFLVVTPQPKVRVYDCSLAEISADIPIQVKEECRKVRAENFNKDLQKPK
jgi:hypothetical protein